MNNLHPEINAAAAVEIERRNLVGRISEVFDKLAQGNPRVYRNKLLLVSMVLVGAEKYYHRQFNPGPLEETSKTKPLHDMKLLELGFGGRDDNHLVMFPMLGAQVAGITLQEGDAQMARGWAVDMEGSDDFLYPEEDIKSGDVTETSKIFPGRRFDLVYKQSYDRGVSYGWRRGCLGWSPSS